MIPQRAREPALKELVSAAAVRTRIEELAVEVAREYSDVRPLVIVIAEGARRFAEALAKAAAVHGFAADELVVRARRTAGTTLQDVTIDAFDPKLCEGRDVLVIDDIADEGRTLAALLERVRSTGPRSLRTAVLVSKQARRLVELTLDHVGFELEDGWVVGFGMDLDGKYRDLDHLAVVQVPS